MLRTALRTLAAASITLALVGCEDAARPVSPKPTTSNAIAPVMSLVTDGAAPPIERTVAPQATDPAINVSLADHYVWLDTTGARGRAPRLPCNRPLVSKHRGGHRRLHGQPGPRLLWKHAPRDP